MNVNKCTTLRWLLALMAVVLVTSCSPEVESNSGRLSTVAADSAKRDSGTVEAKIRRLTEQLQYSKTNWQIYYDRSLLWYEAGNTSRATADIEKAIEYHVTNPDGYHMRGFYSYVQNRDEEALKDFKRAVDLGSDNPETFYHIGQIHFFRKEYDLAQSAYKTAIKLDSMEPTYYFAQGFLKQQRGRTNAAIKDYEAALKRNPTFVKALLALHDIYLNEKRDPDRAYGFNERVMLVDSTQPLAHFNQGNFFYERANKVTDEAKRPEFTVLMKIAISEYSKSLQYDPNYGPAYYNRGYCFYLIEKYPEALADFTSVIELDPFNEKAFFMKASIQEYQGDLSSALSNYRQAHKIKPDFRDAEVAVRELEPKVQAKVKSQEAETTEKVGG